jgi:hypothetical protein
MTQIKVGHISSIFRSVRSHHRLVVSGCPFTEPNDPGNLQIDWMEVQLEMYRKRGMQVGKIYSVFQVV